MFNKNTAVITKVGVRPIYATSAYTFEFMVNINDLMLIMMESLLNIYPFFLAFTHTNLYNYKDAVISYLK